MPNLLFTFALTTLFALSSTPNLSAQGDPPPKKDDGGVGVGAGVTGTLDAAKLTTPVVQASVVSYLKAKPDAVNTLDRLAYLDAVKAATGLTVQIADGKPEFYWQVSAKLDKLSEADQTDLAKTLKGVVMAALAQEKTPANKLKPDDLKAVTAAETKNFTFTPGTFSKMPALNSDVFQNWLKKYLAATPPPAAAEAVKPQVDLARSANALSYEPKSKKLVWQYAPAAGVKLSAADQTALEPQLKAILKASAAAATGADAYPATDLPEVDKVIDGGAYKAFAKSGLSKLAEVTPAKIQSMVTSYLAGSRKEVAELVKLNVAAETESDRELLVKGLVYTEDPIGFAWEYPLADPGKKTTDAALLKPVEDKLRAVLADAVQSGGKSADLKPSLDLYEGRLKEPIEQATIKAKTEFTVKDLYPSVVRDLIEAAVSGTNISGVNPDVAALRQYVTATSLHSDQYLGYDTAGVKFSLPQNGLPLALTQTKDLSAEDQKEVDRLVKKVLLAAFTDAKPAQKLTATDLEKVKVAINALTYNSLGKEKSAEVTKVLEAAKLLADRQKAQEERLLTLEDEVADLKRMVKELVDKGGAGTTPASTLTPDMQCHVDYITQRLGLFGCRTVVVPVVRR